jgi:hypothetical protein
MIFFFIRLTSILLILTANSRLCLANENPMWRFGYEWTCMHGAALTCERDKNCFFGSTPSQAITILYKENRVDIGNEKIRIKRHYSQKIESSPLIEEAKIELVDNSVIWLSPVDASGTYSNFWTGVMVTPKNGVQLSVSLPLFCKPKNGQS